MVYSSFSPCHLNKLLSKFTSVTYSNLPWYRQCLSFLYFTSLSCIEVFSQDLDLPRSLPFSFRNFFHVIGAGICLGDDPLLLPGRTRPVYISRFCNSYLLPLKYSLRWWERDDDRGAMCEGRPKPRWSIIDPCFDDVPDFLPCFEQPSHQHASEFIALLIDVEQLLLCLGLFVSSPEN